MDCVLNVTQPCGTGITGTIFTQLIRTFLATQTLLNPPYPPDRSNELLDSYDFIVVGSGSAGSPLVAKLTENVNWNVLLIEAGGDPAQLAEIPLFLTALQKSPYDWGFLTTPQENGCNAFNEKQCAWPRGKTLGGCSTINAMIYQTGNKRDYDERWNQTGWMWNDVKSYFERHIRDKLVEPVDHYDTTSPMHEIRKSIIEAGGELGYPEIFDPLERSQGKIGYFESLISVKDGQRYNAAKVFLSPISDRKNLHLIKYSHASHVIIDPETKKAVGIKVLVNNEWKTIKATKEVILSAGSLHTPQILMLSGIGHKDHLESLKIPVIQDLPVGDNLQDHPVVTIYELLRKSNPLVLTRTTFLDWAWNYFLYRTGPFATTGTTSVLGFINSENATAEYPDMQFHHITGVAKDTLLAPKLYEAANVKQHIAKTLLEQNDRSQAMVTLVTLLNPKSKGTVRLRSTDPLDLPLVDPQYNSDPDDIKKFITGIRHVVARSHTKAMQRQESEIVPLDTCTEFPYDSDDFWLCWIKNFTTTVYHPIGTARMGTNPKDSVVDQRLKVHGIKGLRVVDASVMPNIISGNTHAPSMMIGERAADFILEDWRKIIHEEL